MTADLRRTRLPTSLDVALFDSARVWTAYLMRQVAQKGFQPKRYRTVTGFELVDWSVTMAAVFDVEGAQVGSSRVNQAAHGLSRLTDCQPAVCRIVLVDADHPAEWLLREAGAVAVYHSIFDVPAMVKLLQRRRGKAN